MKQTHDDTIKYVLWQAHSARQQMHTQLLSVTLFNQLEVSVVGRWDCVVVTQVCFTLIDGWCCLAVMWGSMSIIKEHKLQKQREPRPGTACRSRIKQIEKFSN